MMSLTEIRSMVAEHEALAEDQRMFHDPPKLEIAQHCIDCGQTMEPIAVGWDLLYDAAKGKDGLPVRITTICDGCRTVCFLCGNDTGHDYGCTESRRSLYKRNEEAKS